MHTCKESQQWAAIKGFYGTGGSIKTHTRERKIFWLPNIQASHTPCGQDLKGYLLCVVGVLVMERLPEIQKGS